MLSYYVFDNFATVRMPKNPSSRAVVSRTTHNYTSRKDEITRCMSDEDKDTICIVSTEIVRRQPDVHKQET